MDASSIVFSELKKNVNNAGKTIYINTIGGKARFELPVLRAPFGLSSYTDSQTGKTSYSIDLSLENPDILDGFRKFEKAVFDHVAKNSLEILGKVYTPEVIKAADLFKSNIREGKEPGKYAPTLRLKVLTDRNGKFVPEAYNTKQELVDLATLQKGQKLATIVDINQVWIIDNKFGMTVRLVQTVMLPTNELKGFAFKHIDTSIGSDGDEIIEDQE
jgi:hypothetical protein